MAKGIRRYLLAATLMVGGCWLSAGLGLVLHTTPYGRWKTRSNW